MKYTPELHKEIVKGLNTSQYYDTSIIETLLDEISRLQAESAWIPVSERLPERQGNTSLGVRYLVLYAGYYHDVCVFLPGDNFWSREGVDKTEYVTHWRPLPIRSRGDE